MTGQHRSPRKRSTGFSLITAVVIVLMMSIVGFSAMTASRSQQRSAGSAQYQLTALHEAERAVATAETWLSNGTNAKNAGFTTYNSATSPALYPRDYMSANGLDPLIWTWSSSNSVAVGGNARYAVEKVAAQVVPIGESRGWIYEDGNWVCKTFDLFQISARGTGGEGAARSLQSIFAVQAC